MTLRVLPAATVTAAALRNSLSASITSDELPVTSMLAEMFTASPRMVDAAPRAALTIAVLLSDQGSVSAALVTSRVPPFKLMVWPKLSSAET